MKDYSCNYQELLQKNKEVKLFHTTNTFIAAFILNYTNNKTIWYKEIVDSFKFKGEKMISYTFEFTPDIYFATQLLREAREKGKRVQFNNISLKDCREILDNTEVI